MTTQAFTAIRPKIQAALVHVKTTYCAPPAFKPATDFYGSMQCPNCKSKLLFSASSKSGLTDGRCTAACGVKWSNQ